MSLAAEAEDAARAYAQWQDAVAGVLAKSRRVDPAELGPEPQRLLELAHGRARVAAVAGAGAAEGAELEFELDALEALSPAERRAPGFAAARAASSYAIKLIDAARRLGIDRYVMVSAIGAEPPLPGPVATRVPCSRRAPAARCDQDTPPVLGVGRAIDQ